MNTWRHAIVVAVAGAALLLACQQPGAIGQSGTSIAFTKVEADPVVAAFIDRHGLRVERLQMENNGFSGTVLAGAPTQSAQDLVSSGRTRVVEMFMESLKGKDVRLQAFVSSHSEDQVAASPELLGQARGFLRIRSQIDAVITAARRGDPLVIAVHTRSLSSGQLAALSADSIVSHAAVATPRPPEPPYQDAIVENRDAKATYAEMRRILGR